MDQNQIDYLINSYSFSGTNRPDGIREGTVSPNTFPNSGVPSGLIQTYELYLQETADLATLLLETGNDGTYPFTDYSDQLNIVSLQNNVKGVGLDYPRALEVTVSAAAKFNINISGFDRFYNQITFSRAFDITGPEKLLIDSGIFILTYAEIELGDALADDTSFTLSTSGYAELLYTDYGFAGNLINVTRDRLGTPSFLGPIAEENVELSAGQVFSTFNYYPASWNIVVGYSQGRPRPLLLMNQSDPGIESYCAVTQIVWGIDNTAQQLNTFQTETYPLLNIFENGGYPGDDVPVFDPSVFSVYGRANNVTNWKGWSQ